MRHLFTSLSCSLLMLPALAQDDGPNNQNMGRRATLSGGLEIGIPIGAFSDSWGREIVGLSGNLAVPMRLLPLSWGFDFGWGHMGGERDIVPVSNQYINATSGELSVRSNLYSYHGLLRFQPYNGVVSPYVEGMLGLRHFTTRSEITVEGLSEPVQEQRQRSEFVGSTGWAVGVMVAPTRVLFFEGRVERLTTGNVTFVDPGSISISDQGTVNYNTISSPTRMVNVHLGIGLRF
ncbi:MAG: hypothetical protein JNL52_12590 [Flavobacteriales bacterium]|nr:hypothetical protein [Flavobacteriales bacterium]